MSLRVARVGHVQRVGLASHPEHGENLAVLGVLPGPDRVAMFAVQDVEGELLVASTLAGLRDLGFTVAWPPAPRRRGGTSQSSE